MDYLENRLEAILDFLETLVLASHSLKDKKLVYESGLSYSVSGLATAQGSLEELLGEDCIDIVHLTQNFARSENRLSLDVVFA